MSEPPSLIPSENIPPKQSAQVNPNPTVGGLAGPPGLSVQAVMRASQFSGPLPPPQLLEHYEKICPGSATRMIEMAQIEGEHRRAMEKVTLNANIEAMRKQFSEARIGQFCALIIALVFVFVGGYVITHGQPWPGTVVGGLGLGGIVTAFIAGRSRADQHSESSPDQSSASNKK